MDNRLDFLVHSHPRHSGPMTMDQCPPSVVQDADQGTLHKREDRSACPHRNFRSCAGCAFELSQEFVMVYLVILVVAL